MLSVLVIIIIIISFISFSYYFILVRTVPDGEL